MVVVEVVAGRFYQMDVRCQLRLIYYLLGFVPVEMAALCVCRAAATFGSTLNEYIAVDELIDDIIQQRRTVAAASFERAHFTTVAPNKRAADDRQHTGSILYRRFTPSQLTVGRLLLQPHQPVTTGLSICLSNQLGWKSGQQAFGCVLRAAAGVGSDRLVDPLPSSVAPRLSGLRRVDNNRVAPVGVANCNLAIHHPVPNAQGSRISRIQPLTTDHCAMIEEENKRSAPAVPSSKLQHVKRFVLEDECARCFGQIDCIVAVENDHK
ncbi:hypothetical protein T4C_1799 [Trichinella pseudospiralis]|uniref:Uncharacterized protein n=1 Tax=Trichinella pseudospiralis TaxID=6337 RepID=A0A0V1JBY2_TRIPS|nr:hypothetical protein T4C_1799 [Trichinella pseudospiralis]